MPQVNLYEHGVTVCCPSAGNPDPPKRGKVTGWSATAARRNLNFLRSVRVEELDGVGMGFTLTVRDCPATPGDWAGIVRAWIERMSRRGLRRVHWVMEFQRRAVPHLHGAAWFDPLAFLRREGVRGLDSVDASEAERVALPVAMNRVRSAWLDVAAGCGASASGQDVKPITGEVGWFQYLAKHASRAQFHYQRERASLPPAWESTGRVWGKRGHWPVSDPVAYPLDRVAFWRFRRLLRRRRIAEVRNQRNPNGRKLSYLRRCLKCANRRMSEVRAMSEWVEPALQSRLVAAAVGMVGRES